MMNDENYIIPVPEEPKIESAEPKVPRFPVKKQLVILAVFLVLIFSSVIFPKTLAMLGGGNANLKSPQNAALIIDNDTAFVPQKIEGVEIRAESAYVWDIVGQRALFEKNPDEELPLASITKLMTALVAYELVPDDTMVTISNSAAAEQSGGGIKAGEVFEVKKLADFALVSSYNSAAHTLAESVGKELGSGDPMSQFVAAMNIKAKELDLNTLKYENSTGLDISTTKAGAYGTAREVSFLLEYIYSAYPQILWPTVAKSTKLFNADGDFHEADNTNDVIVEIPNLLGSKTGYTDLAGGNLTIVFDAGFGRPIVVTVLGSTRNERFADVKKLVAAVQESMINSK
jgi:D-alanyl-D-alanine carboxypeptidase